MLGEKELGDDLLAFKAQAEKFGKKEELINDFYKINLQVV